MSEPQISPKDPVLRVAVTSSRGTAVDQHFGRAERFLIFEIGPGEAHFLEARPRPEAPREGDFDPVAELLSDCRAVLTEKAGPHPRERLEKRGILCLEVSGGLIPAFAKAREVLGIG